MLTPKFGRIDAVVFDFDGVLSDSRKLHDQARNIAFTKRAEETGDNRYVTIVPEVHAKAHRHGSTPSTIIGWVLQQAGLVGEDADLENNHVVAAVVAHKQVAYETLASSGGTAVPEMPQLVRCLMTYLPGRLAIATTAARQGEVMPFLLRYGLNRYFPDQLIVAREDVREVGGQLKPDPLVYTMALEQLGLASTPELAVAIEDSLHGGLPSANQAGVLTCALATTHTVEELTQAEGLSRPDFIARDAAHLSTMLGVR